METQVQVALVWMTDGKPSDVVTNSVFCTREFQGDDRIIAQLNWRLADVEGRVNSELDRFSFAAVGFGDRERDRDEFRILSHVARACSSGSCELTSLFSYGVVLGF